jgi:general secretion pathway protein M
MASFDELNTRERTLLIVAASVFGLGVVFLAPLGLNRWLDKQQKTNVELRDAIAQVQSARTRFALRKASVGDVAGRYMNKAPSLGTLLDGAAKSAGLEIATQTDSPPVPRGKIYSERATKIVIQKTGLKALALFLEKIETSGHPVAITAMELTKRIEPDAYVVNMTVSAFDRTDSTPAPTTASSVVRGGPR